MNYKDNCFNATDLTLHLIELSPTNFTSEITEKLSVDELELNLEELSQIVSDKFFKHKASGGTYYATGASVINIDGKAFYAIDYSPVGELDIIKLNVKHTRPVHECMNKFGFIGKNLVDKAISSLGSLEKTIGNYDINQPWAERCIKVIHKVRSTLVRTNRLCAADEYLREENVILVKVVTSNDVFWIMHYIEDKDNYVKISSDGQCTQQTSIPFTRPRK